jgi:hypothetical protein
MCVVRTALAAIAVALVSCDTVRFARSPGEDVKMLVTHPRPPLPEDCRVRIFYGGCTAEFLSGNEFRANCPNAPADELLVGHLSVCRRGRGEMADVNRQVCRAGGNAIMVVFGVTDSCIEERLDGMYETTMILYDVYRLPR